MLFKETKGGFWMEEKYWHGRPALGGWCGWKLDRVVWPTNHPKVFNVYEKQFLFS